jgi:8-oxo-dGTP pyrophosphatase MutT (NUDIX family)
MKKCKFNALCLIYDENFNVLMQLRSRNAPILPSHLGFFGGAIEDNETPDSAIIREINEELNFVGEYIFYKIRYSFVGNFIEKAYIYIAEFTGNKNKIDVLEGEKAIWMNENTLLLNKYKILDHDSNLLLEIINHLKIKREYDFITI